MRVSNYQLRLDNAAWIDVNPEFTQNGLPDRLPNGLAVQHCYLYNLLNCMPGQRARIFEPTYGSLWMSFIQEPIIDLTAANMESMMVLSIDKWIPQIELDRNNTRILADTSLPGYKVRISFFSPFAAESQQIQFEVKL